MAPDHPVFRRTAALAEPRLFLARRPWDDKAKRLKTAITVEETRALKAFFQMSAAGGGWRVAIVDAADEMNPAAANALLKTLEEPPERALILLVCHQPARLLPTIRSRCRVLRCASLGAEDLASALAATGPRRRATRRRWRRSPAGRSARRCGWRRWRAWRSTTRSSASPPRAATGAG